MNNADAFNKARATLSWATLHLSVEVTRKARKIPRVCAADAPDTFEAICRTFDDPSLLTYAVSSVGLDGSVYKGVPFGLGKVCPADMINARARFWHDYVHYTGGFDFSHTGELNTAWAQCRELANFLRLKGVGAGEAMDALALLWIDTGAQAEYYKANDGAFVPDQLVFAEALWGKLPEQVVTRIRTIVVASIRHITTEV